MSEPEAILHIEDDPLVTLALDRELKRLGLKVVAVPTCAAARNVEGDFRVAIFDIDLADGDGVALAEELVGCGKVQRAVFYTGSRDAAALTRAACLGLVVGKGEPLEALLDALPPGVDVVPASGIEGPPSPKASTG